MVELILLNFSSLEKLNIRTAAGKAKVLGTIIGIGGSMLLTFFKGAEINVKTFHTRILHQNHQVVETLDTDSSHKFLGVLCGFGSCFNFALWLIIQVTFFFTTYFLNVAKKSYNCVFHDLFCDYIFVWFDLGYPIYHLLLYGTVQDE